jgi:hypothetical protein
MLKRLPIARGVVHAGPFLLLSVAMIGCRGAPRVADSPSAGTINAPPAGSLGTVGGFEGFNVHVERVKYRGRDAVHLLDDQSAAHPDSVAHGHDLAIMTGSDFADGVLEVDVVGTPRAGAKSDARGYIGLAFHVQPDMKRFEVIYIRPTNARSDDQLRRNHVTQYVSIPDYPFDRSRADHPGVYESYVDVEPGAWTRLRVVIRGASASLYVNNAAQPCLLINDLRLAGRHGAVALWVGDYTDGYFSNLLVRAAQ